MRIFVTGADGLLGSNTILELLKRNYNIKALVHPSSRSQTLANLNIKIIKGDVLNPSTFEREIEDCNIIIHIAALTSVWPSRNSQVRNVNITGTNNLITIAKKAGILKFIHIGSANSFAPGTQYHPATEESQYKESKYKNDYIESKYLCQKRLLEEFEKTRFPAIIIAPTYMIGPLDTRPSSGKLLLECYKGNLPFYIKGVKNFVDVRDVATAVANSVTMGREGTCYLAGGTNLTYQSFFEIFHKTMQKPFKMKEIPYPLALLGGFASSLLARITRRPPKFSYGMAIMARWEQYYNSTKAQKELEMPQTPIEDSIKDCINWFIKNNYC